MMGRVAAFLLVLGAVGCTDGAAPPVLVQDLGAGTAGAVDLAGGGGGGGACTSDMSPCNGADGGGTLPAPDAGPAPAACTTTTCTPGLLGNVLCRTACASSTATCVASGGSAHCTP
jgi:hypothetical protein